MVQSSGDMALESGSWLEEAHDSHQHVQHKNPFLQPVVLLGCSEDHRRGFLLQELLHLLWVKHWLNCCEGEKMLYLIPSVPWCRSGCHYLKKQSIAPPELLGSELSASTSAVVHPNSQRVFVLLGDPCEGTIHNWERE